MRLGKLQWAGLLLSLAWVIGAAMYSHNADVRRSNDFLAWSYRICSHTPEVARTKDLSQCDTKNEDSKKIWMEGSAANAAILALVPLPFFWLGGFCFLYLWRIQVAGFRSVVVWSSLSKLKKALVILCASFVSLALLAVAVALMASYSDAQVPVSLGLNATMYSSPDGTYVQAEGTWTRTDLHDDTIAFPLQTSRIICMKATNQCVEATASVSGRTLMSDLNIRDIDRWTEDSIVMHDDSLCGSTIFVMDLRTKKVSGAGHLKEPLDEGCKMQDLGKTEWSLLLTDGFPVYWQLLLKARPWPLRVIQAVVGN